MKLDDKKVKEIFLGLILVVVLIILIFLFAQPATSSKTSSTKTSTQIPISQNNSQPQTIIINSYNTNSFNEIDYQDSYSKPSYNEKNFKSWKSLEIQRSILGNEIHKYIANVENTGTKGQYFRVRFNLEDCYEGETAGSITKYIKPDETAKFIYPDIKAQYCNWDYEVY